MPETESQTQIYQSSAEGRERNGNSESYSKSIERGRKRSSVETERRVVGGRQWVRERLNSSIRESRLFASLLTGLYLRSFGDCAVVRT